MSWLTEFLMGGPQTSLPVASQSMAKASGPSATFGDLAKFAENFRGRTIDTQDPNVLANDAFTDEHLGAPGVTVEQVRAISRLRPVSMLMSLFATQVGRCGRRRISRNDVGYEPGLKDPRKPMSKAGRKMVEEICAAFERGMPAHRKMHMLARDSASLDLGIGEIAWSRGKNARGGNKPLGWMPRDAATFRLGQLKSEQIATGRAPAHRPIVQYEHGLPVNVFAPEEILWIVRRPRTDLHVQGWGYPEIVEAAETMATLVKAHRFNDNFFENGTHARYFLKFKMSMSPEHWESFRRQFQEQLKGLDNAHKIGTILLAPGQQGVTQPEDVTKESLSESPKDMEFRWGFGFYYRELFSYFGVDPEEVGMGDPADTGRSTMQESDNGKRILMARERRLEPALQAFADEFTLKFVEPFDEDFCIRFHGMSVLSPEEQGKLDAQDAKLMPLNRILARNDQEPLPFKWADECPLDQGAIQLYTAELAAKQAEAQAKAQAKAGPAEGGEDAKQPEGGADDFDPFGDMSEAA